MTAMVIFMSACAAVFYLISLRKTGRPIFTVLPAILALSILALAGSLGQGASALSEANKIPPGSAAGAPTIAPAIQKDAAAFIDLYIDEAIALIDADRRQQSVVTFSYEPKLLYDSLSREEKSIYDEMLENAQNFHPFSYTAARHGHEAMDMALVVYGALTTDHPEIHTCFMLREVVKDNVTTALEALYFMPWDTELRPADTAALREEMLRFEAVCTRIIERMPDDYSAYDQYRYLATVISLVTSFDYGLQKGWQIGTAYGSIAGRHSICQGYSKGFLYLCQKANLWCETVDGVSGGNFAHMWNIVKLDSGTYYLDITWSDEKGLPGSPEWDRYFMLTQDEILVDHEITDGKVATGTAIDRANKPR
jgi:hypothetical protein